MMNHLYLVLSHKLDWEALLKGEKPDPKNYRWVFARNRRQAAALFALSAWARELPRPVGDAPYVYLVNDPNYANLMNILQDDFRGLVMTPEPVGALGVNGNKEYDEAFWELLKDGYLQHEGD